MNQGTPLARCELAISVAKPAQQSHGGLRPLRACCGACGIPELLVPLVGLLTRDFHAPDSSFNKRRKKKTQPSLVR